MQGSLSRSGVRVQLDAFPVSLAVDHAVPLGLVVNELVTNAFKHRHGEDITTRVTLVADDSSHVLTVSDDGAGMPGDFVAATGKGLGMRVVELLVRQLGARIELPAAGEPAHFKIRIPSQIFLTPEDE